MDDEFIPSDNFLNATIIKNYNDRIVSVDFFTGSTKSMIAKSILPILMNRTVVEHSFDGQYLFDNTNASGGDHLFYCGFNTLDANEQLKLIKSTAESLSYGGLIVFPMLYEDKYDHLLQPTHHGDSVLLHKKQSIAKTTLYRLCLQTGCEIVMPVLYGSWSGRKQANQPGFDIVVLRKIGLTNQK